MKLALIPAGTFTMGSPVGESERRVNESQHEVKISKSYFLGVYEVTQRDYELVMGKSPSYFKGAKNPVENVSWIDAVSFCKKLSEIPEEKSAGRVYRLPTEAEWEYACRATSTTSYSFGDTADDLGLHAWFRLIAEGKTHPVGKRMANGWGLYDMHGNVWEWCQDRYADYPIEESNDPQGAVEGTYRVFRGGSWANVARHCRSADRSWDDPTERGKDGGFRVALSPPANKPDSVSSK